MSVDPSPSSVPDSSWNSSTIPSSKLNTVKLSVTAILNPNKAILLYSLSKEIRPSANVNVFEDKSKVFDN